MKIQVSLIQEIRSMSCADTKTLIHLDAGGDLRPDEQQQVLLHVTGCTECRTYQSGMSRAMTALLSARLSDVAESRDAVSQSIWPRVAQAISRRHTSPVSTRRFNLQVAALSVCSLSLALVTIVQSLSSMRESSMSSGFVPSQPVSGVPQMNIGRQPGSPGTRTGEQTPMLEQGMSPMRRDQDTGAF